MLKLPLQREILHIIPYYIVSIGGNYRRCNAEFLKIVTC